MPQNGRSLSSAEKHAISVATDSGTKTRVVTITRPSQSRMEHMADKADIELVMAPKHDPTVSTNPQYGGKLSKTDQRSLSARPTNHKHDGNEERCRHKLREFGHVGRQKTERPNPDWKQYSVERHVSDRRNKSPHNRNMTGAPRRERRRTPDSIDDPVRTRPCQTRIVCTTKQSDR